MGSICRHEENFMTTLPERLVPSPVDARKLLLSALGQKRTCAAHKLMSALGQKRTHAAQKGSLFDHLVGAGKHCRGYHKSERLRGFEIDDQFVFGRRLHR